VDFPKKKKHIFPFEPHYNNDNNNHGLVKLAKH
jgi:hypothetical protein